jgi:MFS family permease
VTITGWARFPTTRVTEARALAALKIRNYRLYFFAQLVSLSGTSMQMIGQSWLVLKTLHGTGVDLGGVTAAQFLPLLVFGPYGGVIADRHDKRRLILVTQSLSAALALLLGILTITGSVRLWLVYLIALALGMVGAIDNPARQVFALDMVGRDLLGNAVSLNEVIINFSRVFGPAIGGIVIAQFSIAACFFANAASFVPPVLAIAAIRIADLHHSQRTPPSRGQLVAGFRYTLSRPLLRSLVLMAAASAMVFNFGVSVPLMAKTVLHSGAAGYGAMVAAFGVGALVGAFLAASDREPGGRRVRLLAVATGVIVVASSLAPTMAIELVAMAATGAASIWFISLANAVVQLRAAPAMRGRVMGLWTMALPGTLPITAPIVGVVAEAFGGRAALALGGVAVLATAALGWRALADPRQAGAQASPA